jgi:hypothetical protein
MKILLQFAYRSQVKVYLLPLTTLVRDHFKGSVQIPKSENDFVEIRG